MTPSEIIASDAERNNLDPKILMGYVAKTIKEDKGVLLTANNSLLLITFMGEDNAELHLFTADPPLTLMKSLTQFVQEIKQSDLKRVYGDSDNQEILELLRRLGIDVMESDMEGFNWMANVR